MAKYPILEKFATDIYRCNRCRQCRYVTEKPLAVINVKNPLDVHGTPFKHAVMPSCPVGHQKMFAAYYSSGKLMVLKRIMEGYYDFDPEVAKLFYTCAVCGACDFECSLNDTASELKKDLTFEPSKIFEEVREILVEKGLGPLPSQKKFSESITVNHNPYSEKHEDRTKWTQGKLENSSKPDLAYFVGCTTSYRQQEVAQATASILEKAGVNFTVLSDEWCCCSPLLRTGQRKLAEETIRHNVKALRDSGVKRVVFSCAGCYQCFKNDYPKIVGDLGFETIQITELLQELINDGKLDLKRVDMKVTYHDPCHLGRHSGVYDAPREVLKAVPGLELIEMPRIRRHSFCCGGGGGLRSGDGELAKRIADVRNQEALETGVNIIASSCPFCELNLDRANKAFNRGLKIIDITEIIDKATPN